MKDGTLNIEEKDLDTAQEYEQWIDDVSSNPHSSGGKRQSNLVSLQRSVNGCQKRRVQL